MKDYSAKPIVAPLITKPGESSEYVGTRNVTDLLPNIFQTSVNKKFLDSTLEQLMSTGSLQSINTHIGEYKLSGSVTDPHDDSIEFNPGAVNRTSDNNISNVLSYADLLNALQYNETDLDGKTHQLNEEGYTLDIPINYDMFINYHNYFFMVDQMPVVDVISTPTNPITIDTIPGNLSYTTPELSNSKTLQLRNGMRIRFSPYEITKVHQTTPGVKGFNTNAVGATTVKVYVNNLIVDPADYNHDNVAGIVILATAPALNQEVEIHSFYTSGTNYAVDDVFIVDGVGDTTGIKFIKQFTASLGVDEYETRNWLNQTTYSGRQPSRFDPEGESFDYRPFDQRELVIIAREYVVEQRWSQDQSAWARSNLWMHEQVIHTICDFLGLSAVDYIKEEYRAIRPIIEYRANMQKYDFGTRHIANVTHVFDNVSNPATEIVGSVSWDLAQNTITDNWQSQSGYNKGALVKFTLGGQPSYWNCIQTHAGSKNPSYFENREYWTEVVRKPLAKGDTILFLESDASYTNKIFRVDGVGASITLTEVLNTSNYVAGDKILTVIGYNEIFGETYPNNIYSGSEWYWNGNKWRYGQQKDHRSEGALFTLYDINLTELDSNTVYPNSTFRGDKIFDYTKGSGAIDTALGFAPKRTDYGNNPGYMFDLELGATRYQYNVISDNANYQAQTGANTVNEINGYYYYKNIETLKYHNGWNFVRNGQSVQRHIRHVITDPSKSLTFNLGTSDIKLKESRFKIFKKGSGFNVLSTTDNQVRRVTPIGKVNPVLYIRKGVSYQFTKYFSEALEFVNLDGTANSNVNVVLTGPTYTVTVAQAQTDPLLYKQVGSSTVQGLLMPIDDSLNEDMKIYNNGVPVTTYSLSGKFITLSTTAAVDNVIDIYYSTDDKVIDADGKELAAPTHVYNSQNSWLATASFGDLQEHMRQQMTGMPNFSGDFFGQNNYKEIPHVHEYGGTIRQQPFSTELISQTLMDTDTNPFSSIKYVSKQYKRFRTQFLQKVRQLHNTMAIEKSTYEIVDQALKDINIGKNNTNAFANSDMAMYTDAEVVRYRFTTSDSKVFDLPKTINTYNDTKNHIQVFVRDYYVTGGTWFPIQEGKQYTLTKNKITLNISEINPTYSSVDGGVDLLVRWFPFNSVSFVPPSSAKLGFVKTYTPELVSNLDIESNGVTTSRGILCHDGSIYYRQGTELYDRASSGYSISDAAIWDLEHRIFNNLSTELNTVQDYKTVMPNAHRDTPYSWTDLTNALQSGFNKWKTNYGILNLQDDDYYDPNNPWTWNYSSVSGGIGGWRGLYTYWFNTDRPHTHPWEMLGYNKKPSWWDTNYSWTNITKRDALIEALKYGHYNDPSEAQKLYDITYAYSNYIWDTNDIVTTYGDLNDPTASNLVATPTSVDAAKPFAFGDIGPIEYIWRITSEYKTSLAEALMRLRPLWMTNTFFRSTQRRKTSNSSISTMQYYFNDTKLLGNNTKFEFSYTRFNDSIVTSVDVVSSDNTFTNSSEFTVYANFGNGANVSAVVETGSVVAMSVDNPGGNYQSIPTITSDDGNVSLHVELAIDGIKYFNGLSNSIVEYAKNNGTIPSDLNTRFENLTFNPLIQTQGFINPSNQDFILTSSQGKGKVIIPEENRTSTLYLNQPSAELFFGGIKIAKVSTGYSITGYDETTQYFNWFKPITTGANTIVGIQNTTVDKYKLYDKDSVEKLYYNTVLTNLQDVYSFILGYGEYLNSFGWTDSWSDVGSDFVMWATSKETNTFVGIPNSTSISISDGTIGYFDNVNKKYDGLYNIIDSEGKQILSNSVLITRELLDTSSPITTFTQKDTNTNIYGLRLYKVALEHAVVFDNVTDFSDTVYSPALGQMHKNIIWRGSRTKDWNGKLYAPGYIIDGNTIYNNFDTTAREADQYYENRTNINNSQLVDSARFNTGYNKPSWAQDLVDLDDDTIYEFVKGSRKYQGTRLSVNAFMRNNSILGGISNADIYEEWAIRTSDYGDVRSRDTIEFELTKSLLTTNPQPIRFSSIPRVDVLSDVVIDIDNSSDLLVTGTAGNNFVARTARGFTDYDTIKDEELYKNDYVTAGLPLLTETDYRVINKDDFKKFPEETRNDYNFYGAWKDVTTWDNKTSYKFQDKVLYQGKTWEMLDPDGSSGLTRPNDPINITGTITLPTIPTSGATIILDGNVVTLEKSAETVTLDLIQATGTQDISSSNVIAHGTTLILGQSSVNSSTITFSNVVNTTRYNDIVVDGSVANASITGSATEELIIDNTSVMFNETQSTSTNISAQAAFINGFNASWTTNTGNITAESINRINAWDALRVAYISANSSNTWVTWLQDYYSSSDAGLNINKLVTEYGTSPSWSSELLSLITSDVTIINNIQNKTYNATNVANGTETISNTDKNSARSALENGQYITAIKNWKIANPNTVFATSTIVTTQSGSGFKVYDVQAIRNRINAANISDVTASVSGGAIRLTKTTSTDTVAFSLRISAATANADVGFASSTTTTNATSYVQTTTPNLTINQVISQINAAQIAGITAQSVAPANALLRILSSNSVLYIGNGTANNAIGIGTGIVPATTSTTTISTASSLIDIIEKINSAGITGVTASNSNNRLKITSLNEQLIVGAGTANTIVGLSAETLSATQTTVSNVFNAIVGSDGNQVFREMSNDPNIFSIWVADNSTASNVNLGYQVYQTMDFDMYINYSCAGTNDADDAEITVAIGSGVTQAHNLAVGDYVFITGSSTVPSIDGIHEVTKVDTADIKKFYIDAYIDKEGDAGNIYPLRPVRFSTESELTSSFNTTINGLFKYNFAGVRQNDEQQPIYAYIDNDNSGNPAVYRYTGTYSNGSGHVGTEGWTKVRINQAQARNDLIENVKIYDADRKTLITTLETYDPSKGIIPGYISSEIDFKLTADIASYNYNNLDGFVENQRAWGDLHVGKRWWDLTTAVYLDYEQGSVDYQQANWGRLFDGSSIDIYEWTRSPVLPEQWKDVVDAETIIDGNAATGEAYFKTINDQKVYQWVETTFYNPRTKQVSTQYFFWVKNKTNFNGERRYNISQLSTILENPSAFNISWCAASGTDKLFLTNIDNLVSDTSVVQVNQIQSSNTLPLTEWTLLSDGDPESIIPEYMHIKIRDSLVSYNKASKRYSFETYSASTSYAVNAVVLEAGKYYMSRVASNLGNSPSTDTTGTYWKELIDYSFPEDTPQMDIDVLMSQPVPDLSLHEYNRYGHLTRPAQSLFRDVVTARQNFVEATNELLAKICLVGQAPNWRDVFYKTFTEGSITYDVSKYWTFADWSANNYDSETVPDRIYETTFDMQPVLGEPFLDAVGSHVYVSTVTHPDGINRPEIYKVVLEDGLRTYKRVWKEKGTIRISEELWNQSKYGKGFDSTGFDISGFDDDSSNVLASLFDDLRSKVFVGSVRVYYNKLWFKMLYQAVTDNTTDDFAFKTTYIKLNVNHPVLMSKTYQKYDVGVVEEFVNTIKPFHTKIRTTTEAVTTLDACSAEVTEQQRDTEITLLYPAPSVVQGDNRIGWQGDISLSGGEFNTVAFSDTIETAFTTTTFSDVYDGNVFIQPVQEGWRDGLYPADIHENISILVQTNASGSTETTDTRSFRMNIWEQYRIQESTAVVDATSTVTAASVIASDHDAIMVDDATGFPDSGVIWMGNERIEYGAKGPSTILGTTLFYCTRGTHGTPVLTNTPIGTTVRYEPTMPVLENFAHYGDNLRLAYNDSGVSLASAGTSPEHAFIRNAGPGTI